MEDKKEYPIKKDSSVLTIILQIISSLVIIAYFVLYLSDIRSFNVGIFYQSFIVQEVLFALLLIGFISSFKSTLAAGFIFIIWYILLITIGRVQNITEPILTMMYFGFV